MSTNEKFANLFAGLDRAYGTFRLEDPVPGKTKRDGHAVTVKQPVTLNHYADHLSGKTGLGIVPIRGDNTCVFGAIDFDSYAISHAKIAARVKRYHLPLIVTKSKSKGAHLWLFLDEPSSAELVRGYLEDCAVVLGMWPCEIFPKQENIGPQEVGNWINLPYFGDDRVAVDTDGNELSFDEFIAAAEASKEKPKVKRKLWGKYESNVALERLPVHDGPPCLMRLLTEGVGEGSRNTVMFNCAVYAQRKTDDYDAIIEVLNADHIDPMVKSAEMLNISKSVKAKNYSFQCGNQPLEANCQQAICSKRKFGIKSSDILTSRDGVPDGALILPGGSQSLTIAARDTFDFLAKDGEYVRRNDLVFRADFDTGHMDLIDAEALRSRIETAATEGVRKVYRESTRGRSAVWVPTVARRDDCVGMLRSESVYRLPNVKAVSPSPILLRDGKVATWGIENEVLIVAAGHNFRQLPLEQAINDLLHLLSDYRFRSPADLSRCVGAILTPLLRVSDLIGGHAPIWIMEADQSHAGKTKLANIVFNIYGDSDPTPVSAKDAEEGGVGGLTESLGNAYMKARIFVFIDNLRTSGPFQNAYLESALTNKGSIPVRVPYSGIKDIDVSRISVVATANDLIVNRDIANRANMVMVTKRPDDYVFHDWGQDIEDHVRENREHYFNCVATILRHWVVDHGMAASDPRGIEHDFRPWATKMDYILTRIMDLDPPFSEYRQLQVTKVDTEAAWLEKFAKAITDPHCTDVAHQWNRQSGISTKAIFDASGRLGIAPPVDSHVKLGYVMRRLVSDRAMFVVAGRWEVITAERTNEHRKKQKVYSFSDLDAKDEDDAPY